MTDDPNKQDEKHRPPPKKDKADDAMPDDLVGETDAASVARRRDPKHDPPIDTAPPKK